jgi:pyrimidine operon attenuation protein / uracil phosphoribosyltransferase
MADEILERNDGTDRLSMLVGIQRRGVQTRRAHRRIIKAREGVTVPRGALDITLYRDDLQTVGPRPVVGPRTLPGRSTASVVVIVDDVLYTGRTIRAALDELADFGRPARIALAVLVDRGGRELPIHADIVGKKIDVTPAACRRVRRRARRPRRGDRRLATGERVTLPSARTCSGSPALGASRSRLILDTPSRSSEISERAIKKVPTLRGMTIVNLFFEPSTRTRISFEFAEKR